MRRKPVPRAVTASVGCALMALSAVLALPAGSFAESTLNESAEGPFASRCDAAQMPTGQGQHQWGSSYTNWESAGGGVRMEQSIVALQLAPKSFYTKQFDLTGARGGYIGLQTDALNADGTLQTNARFSIWDSATAQGDQCKTFGGEGVGYTCELEPFSVDVGVVYTLTVERQITEADGTWWQGSVTNENTGATQVIGQIRTRHQGNARLVSGSTNFVEYWGPRAQDCNSVPQSIVSWTAPWITKENGDEVQDAWQSFSGPTHELTCAQGGVQSSGQIVQAEDGPFYRMSNGSVAMCRAADPDF